MLAAKTVSQLCIFLHEVYSGRIMQYQTPFTSCSTVMKTEISYLLSKWKTEEIKAGIITQSNIRCWNDSVLCTDTRRIT